MTNLFTRLYIKFTATLLLLLVVVSIGIYCYGYLKLKAYAINRVSPVAALAFENWQTLEQEEQNNWLALMSTFSGTQWQLTDVSLVNNVQITNIDPLSGAVTAHIKLNDKQAVNLHIGNWADWHKTHGWLILGAVSNVSAELREAKFQVLNAKTPWPLARVNRDNEPLNAIALRQLSNGQSIRETNADTQADTFYYPGGSRQLIRLGPIPAYQLFGPLQWVAVFVVSLVVLGISFSLWVRPIQRRFSTLLDAVDAINESTDSVKKLTDSADDIGRLARHIERMALGLIEQIRLNKQLNQAVSHDLKTPLARIQFALALLPNSDDDPYVEQIRNDVTLLTDLTNELLLFHQLKQSAPEKTQCWAKTEITNSLNNVPDNVQLQVELPSSDVQLPMLATHWRRITDNLIKNAVQYGHGKLKVSLSREANQITLKVEDNGRGLSPDDFEQLKQPFQRQQIHRNLNDNNHGLGLAIVDATVSHYGGELSVCPSPLGGTCFCVHLHFTNNVGLE